MAILYLALLCLMAPFPADTATALPADFCEDVLESLKMGVVEGLLTVNEAKDIYEGCGDFMVRETEWQEENASK